VFTNSAAFAAETLYHVAITYSGNSAASGVKIYIDGVLQVMANALTGTYVAMENSAVALEIGRAPSGTASYFAGKIDDLRIWSTERSAAQIAANMDVELTGSESGLVGYWKFNETSGTTAADSTSNAKTFTLSATSGSVPVFRPFDGMDVYRWDAATNAQVAGDVFWDFTGV
jgi:hypothetical protein